jgi:DNA-binding NtrC family response regulator
MRPLKEHIDRLDSWINGRRVIHLDTTPPEILTYQKAWRKMSKQFIIENGHNIRWECVKNASTFIKQCEGNSLKAVVVDISLNGNKCGIEVVSELKDNGVITCPVFFIDSKSYEDLPNKTKRRITNIGAYYMEKTFDCEQIKKNIQKIVK